MTRTQSATAAAGRDIVSRPAAAGAADAEVAAPPA